MVYEILESLKIPQDSVSNVHWDSKIPKDSVDDSKIPKDSVDEFKIPRDSVKDFKIGLERCYCMWCFGQVPECKVPIVWS